MIYFSSALYKNFHYSRICKIKNKDQEDLRSSINLNESRRLLFKDKINIMTELDEELERRKMWASFLRSPSFH